MSDYLASLRIAVAGAVASTVIVTANYAVELDRPPSFTRRLTSSSGAIRPTKLPPTRRSFYGDPTKPGLYIYINKFKPNRFGSAHYPSERSVHHRDRRRRVARHRPRSRSGARDTAAEGLIFHRPRHESALGRHQGGDRRLSDRRLRSCNRSKCRRTRGPYAGGDPSALTLLTPRPDPVGGQWREPRGDARGRSGKAGALRANAHVEKGQFQPSAFSSQRPFHHRAVGHLVGRHRQQVRSRASDGPDEPRDLRHSPRERRALGWRQGRGHDDPHHWRRPGNGYAGRRGRNSASFNCD